VGLNPTPFFKLWKKTMSEKKKSPFQKQIQEDLVIKKHLTQKQIDECFDLDYHLRHVDTIFERVFDEEKL